MLPKSTAAVKYVFTPGQVKRSFWYLRGLAKNFQLEDVALTTRRGQIYS